MASLNTGFPNMSNRLAMFGVTVNETIGVGKYSRVLRGRFEEKNVAIKFINHTEKRAKFKELFDTLLPRELTITAMMNHPFVVQNYKIIQEIPNMTVFIMEYCENRDLLHLIKKKKQLTEAFAKILLRQLVDAVAYLVRSKVAHRDIKCENVLLDGYYNVKLTDFGLARSFFDGELSNTFCGSLAYAAPELILQKSYNAFMSDIWAVGVVTYVMTTGNMPFDGKDETEVLTLLAKGRLSFPQEASPELRRIIKGCLEICPKKRCTTDEMITSEFLKDTKLEVLTTMHPNMFVPQKVGSSPITTPTCDIQETPPSPAQHKRGDSRKHTTSKKKKKNH